MQARSAVKATLSSRPSPPTAQQQVLFDMNLLGEVLGHLGADVAECRAALLVSRAWGLAFEQ